MTASIRVCLWSAFPTWQTIPSTSSPSPRNSAKARSTLSAFLDEIQTLAPSSASLRAAANPIPSVDAVTIAVLPESAYFYDLKRSLIADLPSVLRWWIALSLLSLMHIPKNFTRLQYWFNDELYLPWKSLMLVRSVVFGSFAGFGQNSGVSSVIV